MRGGRRWGGLAAATATYVVGSLLVDAGMRALVPVLVLPPVVVPLTRGFLALGLVVLLTALWLHGGPEE